MRSQTGVTLIGMLMVSVIVVFVALIGFKLLPSYIEYFTIKRVIQDIQGEVRGGTARDMQKAFNRRATIDNISSVKAEDLDLEKRPDGGFDVRALYTVRVPLFGNVNACIDFDVNNGK